MPGEGDELVVRVYAKNKVEMRKVFYCVINMVNNNLEGMIDRGVAVKKYRWFCTRHRRYREVYRPRANSVKFKGCEIER